MKTKSCTIRLLNKTYDIKCPKEETETLKLAALKLNTHMLEYRKQYRQLDEFQTLLLASLKVSHELINTQAKQEERKNQLTEFINSLETKINAAAEDV